MIINLCRTCSAEFTRRNNPNRVYSYCSYKCRAANAPNNRSAVPCKHCCEPFLAWPHEVRGMRKYCSKRCTDQAQDLGRTSEALRVRSSAAYAVWRTKVFERDDYRCRFCGVRGGKLNADHIRRFADFPELRLSVDNGRTLCVPCHRKTDTYGNRRTAAAVSAVMVEA